MKNCRFRKFIMALFFLLLEPQALAFDYVVKPKDTLTQIAHKHIRGPIYKKQTGSLAKILKVNPRLKNTNLILAGMIIRIPDQGSDQLSENVAPLPLFPLESAQRDPGSLDGTTAKPQDLPGFNFHKSEFWVGLGIGTNYTHLEQKRSELNANYRGISAPSLFLESGISIAENTAVAASFKKTPGKADNASLGSGKLAYDWTTIGVEGLTLLSDLSPDVPDSWSVLYGFQYHSLPIVSYAAFTYEPALKDVLYLNGSLGLKYQHALSADKFISAYGRYQHPVSTSGPSGTNFQMTSPIIFDGSVGGEYKMTEALWGGIYWYGQLHSYKMKYSEGSTLNEGTQNIFYSNIELRLNLRF